jgi:adenylate cyclase
MGLEIERKFLVKENFNPAGCPSELVVQGYLSTQPDRTVRIRIKGNKGFITIKGESSKSGLSRFEWEKEIDVADAKELLKLCEPHLISKTRHYMQFGNHTFEVDEFHEKNAGLVIAEIELASEDEYFDKPDWLGKEVTNDVRYYNAYLKSNPYKNWMQEKIFIRHKTNK